MRKPRARNCEQKGGTINPSESGFGASNALWGERGTDDKVHDKSKLKQCVRGLLRDCPL